MSGALDGLKVIDFGQYIAGPMTGMLLADHGADVIKVDPPNGPPWNPPGNAIWNRGKRSILLDLNRSGDRAVAHRLIATADVVVENFRPGVMARLGLGFDTVRASNTGLIYCSLPGFASDDPRANLPAWEGVVGAATATYRLNPETRRPVFTPIPIASTFAAFQGAVSIVMALIAREKDGQGQHVEMPLFDGMFTAMGSVRLRDRPTPPGPGAASPWTRQFQCKDGRWVQFHAINLGFQSFLEAVGATSWAFGPSSERLREELFRTRTAQEWEEFAESVGTECVVCRTSEEWLNTPQARESIVVEVDDRRFGRMRQPGVSVRLSETPGMVTGGAPEPGAQREEILAEVASGDAKTPAKRDSSDGPPVLSGVRVLDLTMFLAGPSCGRTLAEFGADVIKIVSPHREEALVFHLGANRGKRSIRLDLKSAEGLNTFWKLVENADVVLQNFRKGVVERLGIGYEQVRLRRPNIIYAALNTYGQVGPWADRPGHEQLAQAATGMQARQGGTGRPAMQPFAVTDYGTGLLGAFGIALALFVRGRSGKGQHVDSALAYTACLLQSPFMSSYEGKTWDEPKGDCLGTDLLNRLYQGADGWFFLAAQKDQIDVLTSLPGLENTAGVGSPGLEQLLEARFSTNSVARWVSLLQNAGIGAHALVTDLQTLMADPWVEAHGLSLTRDHEGVGYATTTGPAPRLSRTPVVAGNPASMPGADGPAILEEAFGKALGATGS